MTRLLVKLLISSGASVKHCFTNFDDVTAVYVPPSQHLSLCVTFSCKCPVTDDEASRRKVAFHQPPAALAYALFAANRPICADRLMHY